MSWYQQGDNSSQNSDEGAKYLAQFRQSFEECRPCEPVVLDDYETGLIERIRKAFEGVRLEDGIGLMQAEAEDDYASMDVQHFLAQYEERENWSSLTANHLNTCSCALSYVDAKGFRFLIPAFVIHDIMGQLTSANPYYSLTYNRHGNLDATSLSMEEHKQLIIDKCALLSDDQKAVLQEYIRYYRNRDGEYYTSLWDTPEDTQQGEFHEKMDASHYSEYVPSAKNWIRNDYPMCLSRQETMIHAVDDEQKQWLLRIIPGFLDQSIEWEFTEKISRKHEEIRIHRELVQSGIPLPSPLETGAYGTSGRIYILQPWIQGMSLKDLEGAQNKLSFSDCYHLGLQAGQILKAIHSSPVLPLEAGFSDDLIREEFERYIQTHKDNKSSDIGLRKALNYVRENISQQAHTPAVFLHGNYTTEHIFLKDDDSLSISNLKSWTTGDAARDFSALLLQQPFQDLDRSISFATGQIDGYCDHTPTDNFFKRIAFYTAFHHCFYNQIHTDLIAHIPYNTEWLSHTYHEWKSHIPTWYSGKSR